MEFHDKNREQIYKISIVNNAYERIGHDRAFIKYLSRMFTKHNADVRMFVIIYIALFIVAGLIATFYIGLSDAGAPKDAAGHPLHLTSASVQFIFGATVFGAAINLVSRLIETAQKRLGTIDLFISEILSIGRVFTSGNIVGGLIYCYDQVDRVVIQYAPNPPPLKNFPIRYGEALRRENYLSIFDKNSPDLGPFAADVVSNVTAFYTFLRASRDATGAMSLWSNEHYPAELRKQDFVIIVYYCLLLAIHGRESVISLIEDKYQLKFALDVFNTIETQAFAFLAITLPPDDPRSGPIEERKAYYKQMLKKKDNPNYDYGTIIAMIDLIDRRLPASGA